MGWLFGIQDERAERMEVLAAIPIEKSLGKC